MKYALLLVVAFTLFFTKASAQIPSNALPWDIAYKIPKDEKRVIKGEKGKIIVLTYWRMENYVGNVPVYLLKFSKFESQTGEKIEFSLIQLSSVDDRHFLLRENEELLIEARSSIQAYFSGYIYDVR